MAKRYWTGDQQPARLRDGRRRLCIGCHHPIVYGDRCQDCRDRLRQRQRRKRR
jgi:hypothetical protein